jgi:very-short-patch-repair endonuclease
MGRKHTPEAKAKISASKMGHAVSAETRAKISAAHKGRPGHKHTADAKAKISAAKIGHSVSQETREKISRSLTGTTHAPLHRSRMITSIKAAMNRSEVRANRAVGRANYLHANPSRNEQLLIRLFDAHGIRYKFQVVIGGRYIADFVVGRMTFEVDSVRWRGNWRKRDLEIKRCGYGVVRVNLG